MADGIFSVLPNYRVTSPSGMRNLFGQTRMHKGLDLGAPTGTPVASPVAGKVLRKGFDTSGYGNFIIIQEPDGSTRRFSHLASMPGLQEGDPVTPGMVIGEVGSTGRSTGPHLDYVMRDAEGNLKMPEVADESLYRAFGQAPRPRGDSTPRPIDPQREVMVGTGAMGGTDLRKGMMAGPAEFARLDINQAELEEQQAEPLRVTVGGGLGELTAAKQLQRLTEQAEAARRTPMDRDGLANIIRDDMRQNSGMYPAGLLAEEGIMDSPNRMRAEPIDDGVAGLISGDMQANPEAYNAIKEQVVDAPEAALDALGAEKPESKFNLAGLGNALVDIGAGIALLEGDTKSAKALQAMSKSNKERETELKQRNAAINLFKVYGMSQENSETIVDSGAANSFLSNLLKADDKSAAVKNYEFLLKQGVSQNKAIGMAFGKGGTTVNVGDGAPELGKIPTGYQVVYDPATKQYNMQAVEGGPAAQEAEEEARAEQLRAEQTSAAGNIVMQEIASLKEKMREGPPITGAFGTLAKEIPGSKAFDASENIKSIVANIGFDRLQQMREASPTGGALGAISDRELSTLQAVMGSLDQAQSEEQFSRNLNRLEEIYTEILRKASTYKNAAEFGFAQAGQAPTQSQPQSQPQSQNRITIGPSY